MKLRTLVVTALTLMLGVSAFASDSTKVDFSKKRPVKTINLVLPSDRTVVLRGAFTAESVGSVMAKMKEMAATKKDAIYLVINSPGGSVLDGFELIDLIQSLKKGQGIKTTCIVQTEAYSMGALTALYCDKTYMQKHSSIMFHEAAYGVQGSVTQVNQRVEFISKYFDELNQDIADQMGTTKAIYTSLLTPEYWKTANDAAELGIVDGIVDQLYYTVEPTEDRMVTLFGRDNKNGNIVINPLRDLLNESNQSH